MGNVLAIPETPFIEVPWCYCCTNSLIIRKDQTIINFSRYLSQAALAVAFFNIKIPELLGIFVNTLSRYAKIGDKVDSDGFLQELKWPALNLFGMYVLQSGFTFIYILLLSQIGEQLAAKIRQDLFKQIIIQDLSFFDDNRTGELVNR